MPDDAEPTGEIVLYQTEDGRARLECRFADETLWLSQALIAELFQTTPQNVTQHLKAIYGEGELQQAATRKDFQQVRQEGNRQVRRTVRHYSLDAILAVGYRVRSPRGTQFRIWATERLREYLVKGFTMDDERLRNPPVAGSGLPDCFDELLERIRDIRASERRVYLRVWEILALAADYELRRHRHDGRGADRRPGGPRPSQHGSDVLEGGHGAQGGRHGRPELPDFLRFNERQVLPDKGRVSKPDAEARAEAEYERFAARRRALLEAEAERAQLKALEEAAKALPVPSRKTTARKPRRRKS